MNARLAIALASLLLAAARPGAASAADRIGLYDSRAVAIAYAGSACMKRETQALATRHRQAREAGDEPEAARARAAGEALQGKLHRQGFGTAPVEDLLPCIADALPGIREAAGVSALLSKWDAAGLARHPGAATVDVTMRLVEAYQPDERTRKNAREIQRRKPVPPGKLDKLDPAH